MAIDKFIAIKLSIINPLTYFTSEMATQARWPPTRQNAFTNFKPQCLNHMIFYPLILRAEWPLLFWQFNWAKLKANGPLQRRILLSLKPLAVGLGEFHLDAMRYHTIKSSASQKNQSLSPMSWTWIQEDFRLGFMLWEKWLIFSLISGRGPMLVKIGQ